MRTPPLALVLFALFLVIGHVTTQNPSPQGGRVPDTYPLGPDSERQPNVPKGRVEGPLVWKSTIYSNTVRQY